MYFVQPEKGQEFSESLKNLGIKIESLTIIPSDRHEKTLLFKAIAGSIVIALYLVNVITRPASTSPGVSAEAIEVCLKKYIRGDTVEKHEIEEAGRKCAP